MALIDVSMIVETSRRSTATARSPHDLLPSRPVDRGTRGADESFADDASLQGRTTAPSGIGPAAAGLREGGWSEQRAAAAVRAALFDTPVPPSLPRYQLVAPIGRGAMGEVWRARDPLLGREVAVKLLAPRSASDTEALRRVAREARALARLSHPNVVAVFDVGQHRLGADAIGIFIVMELVDGGSLDAWLAAGRHAQTEIVAVFRQAAAGLAAAHAAGMVHRDFKPGNVLIGRDARVRVGDFGLARIVRSGGSEVGDPRARELDEAHAEVAQTLAGTLTATGTVLGTPLYMAPEQHTGGTVDARSDQFAFCVALFEAVYGRRPYTGNLHALAEAKRAPPVLTRAESARAPQWLRAAILRGLAPRPQDRWPSMDALRDALAPRRRRWIAAAGLAVAAVVAAPAWLAAAPSQCEVIELATRHHGAAATWERALVGRVPTDQLQTMRRRLERWTAALHDGATAACDVDATGRTPQAACLRTSAAALDAVLEIVHDRAIDPERVHALLDGLPDPAACATATDELGSDRAAQLDARLARGRSLADAGLFDEALREIADVRAELDDPVARVGLASIWIRAGIALAGLHADLRHPSELVSLYESSYYDAIEAGLDELAGKCARHLAMHHASEGEFAEAERWAAHAEAAESARDRAQREPWLIDFMHALVAYYRRDTATARALLTRVIEVCSTRPCGGTVRASARGNLARSLSLEHRWAEAQQVWRDVVDDDRATYGRDAPTTLGHEGYLLEAIAAEDPARGHALLLELVARIEAMDPQPPLELVARTQLHLAASHSARGEYEQAWALAMRAADALQDHEGLRELRAVALSDAAGAADALGDAARTLAAYDAQVLADPNPASRLAALNNRGAYLARAGRFEEAAGDLIEARELALEHYPTRNDWTAEAHKNVALVLATLGRCDAAEEPLAQALAAWTAMRERPEQAESLRDLQVARATCETQRGNLRVAATAWRAALEQGGPTWADREDATRKAAELERAADLLQRPGGDG
ncbi:MAG: serine/threonine-protein kinase [Nannocystaceae bacterium]|nr:serine/threonine-protein kinase [Nannocystaceae bacterium]